MPDDKDKTDTGGVPPRKDESKNDRDSSKGSRDKGWRY